MNTKWKGAFVALMAATILVASTAFAAEPEKKLPAQAPGPAVLPKLTKATMPAFLQEISVTIRTDRAEGSGTLIVRGPYTYVFTAGHVVDDLREVREVIDPVRGKKLVIEFRNAKVITILREDGEAVGRVELEAEVVTYSDSENGEDIALLRVKKKNYATRGAFFYRPTKEEAFPPVGTELYHCGSLLGEFGSNSLINGIISQIGRVYQKKLYDQTNVNAFPGSSGGGVYIQDTGAYCGMIVRGTYGGFNLMVPQRRIANWAKRMKVEWLLDSALPAPQSEDELRKISIEDTGFPVSATPTKTGNGHHSVATKNRVGFLIRPLGSDGASLMEETLAPSPDSLLIRMIRDIRK